VVVSAYHLPVGRRCFTAYYKHFDAVFGAR
jgi:hypothetical protein